MLKTLESSSFRLTVAPEIGASVAGLSVRVGDTFRPLMRETPDAAIREGNPSKFSSFSLVPFSNRLRDARFTFRGKAYQLRTTSADGSTQHGDVRSRPYQTERETAEELVYVLESRDFPDFNFPFPLRSRVAYRLKGDVLETELSLTNVGDSAMPAGFGLHPYFKRALTAGEEVRLGFEASGYYETDDSFIPTEGMKPLPPELEFGEARAVGSQALNHGLGGWNGWATLDYPLSKVRVVMEADEVFSHLVLFTPSESILAVEPVTNATDGFNLFERGVEGTGVRVLEPGETMVGTVRLRLERL